MTDASNHAASGWRLRGVHFLIGVVAFFAVVIAVDVTFSVLAVRTFPGEVSVTPYEDGLIYNQHLAQQKAQDALGWRAVVAANPGEVSLTYSDRTGALITGLEVQGKLEKPATEAGRIPLKFIETSPGRYVAPTGAITGAWDMTATAQSAKKELFVAERRLTWP